MHFRGYASCASGIQPNHSRAAAKSPGSAQARFSGTSARQDLEQTCRVAVRRRWVVDDRRELQVLSLLEE